MQLQLNHLQVTHNPIATEWPHLFLSTVSMADQGWSRNCISLVLQTSGCLLIGSLAAVENVVGVVNVVNNVNVAAVLRNSLAPVPFPAVIFFLQGSGQTCEQF